MSIKDTWATIPDYPHYEVLYDDSKGVKVRSKKRLRGRANGIASRGYIGGMMLSVSNGHVTLRKNPNGGQERYTPEELWLHTFKEKRLVTPAERRERRIAEAQERRINSAI